MAHTDQDTDVAIAIETLLTANKVTLALDDVLYGNHTFIPRASAAIVIPLGHRRELAGVAAPGGRTLNTLMVSIDLHYSKVGDEESMRKAVDAKGVLLENLIHQDTTVGGIIIHGFITEVDRGETTFANNSMFRTVHMIFMGQTKTYLSPAP